MQNATRVSQVRDIDQEDAAKESAQQKLLFIGEAEAFYTDFLISPGDPIIVHDATGWRVGEDDQFPAFSRHDVESLLSALDEDWKINIRDGRISKTVATDNWQLRISAYLAFAGTVPMMQVRRITRYPRPMKEIGLVDHLQLMTETPRGIIFVSGATGAGKSTTVASLVDNINQRRQAHIVTIEDPIEYTYRPAKAVFSQREVGIDTPSFAHGARDALRQSPDVIVIGEIRDKETAETALLAAESGHLVIATVHANSAYGAIQKILSYFPGESEARLATIAANLVGVIHQVMLPQKDKKGILIASELLFNHKQQFSEILVHRQKVQEALETSPDKVSCSMATSLIKLIKENKVDYIDALAACLGQAAVYSRVLKEGKPQP